MSDDARRTLNQRAHGVAFEERGRWWNGLTDHHRRLLSNNLAEMLDQAFLAGVKAGLEEGVKHARDIRQAAQPETTDLQPGDYVLAT